VRSLPRTAAALGGLLLATTLLVPTSDAAPTWLAPAATVDTMTAASGSFRIAVTPSGDAVAVWSHANSGSNSYIRAATRAAGAAAWSSPVDLTSTFNIAGNADLVIDGAGNATAVWTFFDGAHNLVQSSTKPASGDWSMPVTTLSDPTVSSSSPRVAVAADGALTAVWITGFRIVTADRPAGGAWSSPAFLTGAATAADSPRIATDAAGNTVAVWRRISSEPGAPPGTWKIEGATRDPGQAWGALANVSDVTNLTTATDPEVEVLGGTATAMWAQSDGTKNRLDVAEHPLDGAWTAPLVPPISDAGWDSALPDLDFDASGAATAVWVENLGTDYRVRTASRPAGSTTWSAAETLGSGTTVVPVSGQQDAPHVDVSPGGQAAAVWLEKNDPDYLIRGASRTPGGAWSAGHDLTPAAGFDGYPDVAVDASGNAMAWWLTLGMDYELQTTILDGVGPAVTATIPATGTAGKAVSFAATASDVWSPVSSYLWSFGDGAAGGGASLTHTYVAPGTYAVTVTVTDAVGNATTSSGSITVSAATPTPTPTPSPQVKPVLRKVSLTHDRIRAVGADSVKLPKRTTLKLTLNVAALVRIRVKAVTPGGLKRAFNRDLLAGAHKVRFSARVDGTKLPPGRYQVVVKAHNSAGSSPKKVLKLRIVGEKT
jgi:hypothetical protein